MEIMWKNRNRETNIPTVKPEQKYTKQKRMGRTHNGRSEQRETEKEKNNNMRAHRSGRRKIMKKSHAKQKSETVHRQAKTEREKSTRSANEIISMQSHQLTECLRFKNYVPSVSETPAHRFDFFFVDPSACSSYCLVCRADAGAFVRSQTGRRKRQSERARTKQKIK